MSSFDAYSSILAEQTSGGPGGFPSGYIDGGAMLDSLLLLKPQDSTTLTVAHGGGAVFASTSDVDYIKILRWIAANAQNN